jgi:hypothetical protein
LQKKNAGALRMYADGVCSCSFAPLSEAARLRQRIRVILNVPKTYLKQLESPLGSHFTVTGNFN